MFNLSPKNDKFFDMFIEFSGIIDKSAAALRDLVVNPVDAEQKFTKIKDIEHEGDAALHKIFEELNDSFITPIDREDIYIIGKALDDVLDFMETTASRYVIFNLKESTECFITMADLVVKSAKDLITLTTELKNMKKSKLLFEKILVINSYENEGDVTFRKGVRELFDGQHDSVDIITKKEVYECLESVLDAYEDVANIIEGVVMKHA